MSSLIIILGVIIALLVGALGYRYVSEQHPDILSKLSLYEEEEVAPVPQVQPRPIYVPRRPVCRPRNYLTHPPVASAAAEPRWGMDGVGACCDVGASCPYPVGVRRPEVTVMTDEMDFKLGTPNGYGDGPFVGDVPWR